MRRFRVLVAVLMVVASGVLAGCLPEQKAVNITIVRGSGSREAGQPITATLRPGESVRVPGLGDEIIFTVERIGSTVRVTSSQPLAYRGASGRGWNFSDATHRHRWSFDEVHEVAVPATDTSLTYRITLERA